MQDLAISYQEDSLTRSVRVFLLGMAVAFLISIGISYESRSALLFDHSVVDCGNPTSLSSAEDQSRNGIANACL